jgi:uncharacterized membrane protein YqgA involved in biofilm formation
LIGLLIGLITNSIFGGIIAIFINIDKNLDAIRHVISGKEMKKQHNTISHIDATLYILTKKVTGQ